MSQEKQFDKNSALPPAVVAEVEKYNYANGYEWNAPALRQMLYAFAEFAIQADRSTPSHVERSADQPLKDAVMKVQRAYLKAMPKGNSDMDAAMIELLETVGKFKIRTLPSTTPQKQEGEHKSLAGQAIEMAISALRDIHRRAPGTRTFFDYEAFIERELVPAMEMADKDRQGCIGLMGLLAKEKLKVEELKSAASAIARRWIPVSERVPTEARDEIICLAFTPTDSDGDASVPGAFAASYDDGEWHSRMDTGCWEPGEVTHWMPLPEAPLHAADGGKQTDG